MSRYTTEWWEEVLDLKVPEQDSGRRWLYRFMAVCLITIFVSNFALMIRAGDLLDTVFPASNILFWVLFSGAFVGPDGIFFGASVRAGVRTWHVGRRVRIFCTIALMAFSPFYFAAMGGSYVVEPGGYSWSSGLLVGGGIGLALTLFCCAFVFYNYRKIRNHA